MIPEIKILGLTIHTYGLALAFGFFIAAMVARKRAPRYGFTPSQAFDYAIYILLMGVVGARLAYIIQDYKYFVENPGALLGKFEGLTSFGGIILGGLTAIFIARRQKKSPWAMMDMYAVPFLIGSAIGRVGCLLNGCCYGGICELPWGIEVKGLPHHYHPAQIYESLMILVGIFLLLLWERRKLMLGQSIAAAFMIMGLARFIYEFWRAGTVEQVQTGVATSTYMGSLPITQAQAVALIMLVAGVIIYFTRKAPVPIEEVSKG